MAIQELGRKIERKAEEPTSTPTASAMKAIG